MGLDAWQFIEKSEFFKGFFFQLKADFQLKKNLTITFHTALSDSW